MATTPAAPYSDRDGNLYTQSINHGYRGDIVEAPIDFSAPNDNQNDNIEKN